MNRYAIALGSNRGHERARTPRAMIVRAINALADKGIVIEQISPIIETAPLGPSRRRYANAAVIVATNLDPPSLLILLKQVERDLGRRCGQRWGARTIDLDIILWCGGRHRSASLTVPHPQWRERAFVLRPLAAIAPEWREPGSSLSVRQIFYRHRTSRQRPKVS